MLQIVALKGKCNMELNVQDWKEFKVGELFEVKLAKGDIKLDDVEPGNIPLVSSGETNNGIIGYVNSNGDGKSEVFTGNKITVDMFGSAYYQENDFFAVSHGRVNVLVPKFELTKNIGLFIATAIQQERYKYSYGRAVYSDVAANIIVKLPTKEDGTPDWQFMEDYIRSLNSEPLTTEVTGDDVPDLDIANWGEFSLEDIFGAPIRGTRITTLDRVPGNIPFVTAGEQNNGVSEHISNDEAITYHNAITIDMFGNAFFHEYDFKCDDNILVITNNHMNRMTGNFLATIITMDNYKCGYGRQYRQGDYYAHKISLPVKEDGTPDWDFMERYIRSLPYGDRL